MLQFFRNFFNSKLGIGITLGFVGLIALAFAGGDVANNGGFGGVAGGDRAATVGKKRIGTAALSQAATSALENMKQDNPRLSMKAFLAQDGLSQVLDQMIDRNAIGAFGEAHGIIAGDRLVDSEIAKIPTFRGPDGSFSETAYKQMLQQRGLTDQLVREDLGQGLVAKMVLVPASFGTTFPRDMALRYAALLREHRVGSIGLVPSAAFAPKTPPTDAELTAFYAKSRNSFIRPERRAIRYAVFDGSALKSVAAPTDAEIAARYNANKALYSASETRKLTQLIAPTEAAARAIMAEVAKGTPLDKAAAEKGLSTAGIPALDKQALSTQASQAVADAVFAAGKGALAGPAKSALGWHLIRVDGIENKPARSLEQVRGELFTQIAAEKRRTALSDFTARIEDEFDNGGSLSDVAKELAVNLTTTEPLTADGQVYGQPGKTAPVELAKVIQTAFAMERENQPQLAEIEAGKKFLIYDVTTITTSAPAPMAEVKDALIAGVQMEKGATAAKAAAQKAFDAAKKGTDLAAAMASVGAPLPPVQRIDMGRMQLTQMGQQVPPPLTLLFSMAEGTAKLLPVPGNRGWYVVALKDIVPGAVQANDPVLPQAQKELGGIVGREYADELRRAIRAEVGVKKNDTAIAAVRSQLNGGN
ncbi:MAG: peptidyl-prolyl cis-trans isomerase [Sphingomonadales bacterium]|nr:peptidyl-prolyl cis-trans isomerase [Sphingomonadales bacterium]